MKEIEVAIIGAGPAGISAALNLAKLNRQVTIFDRLGYSEKIKKAERIQNYPGIIDITGEQLKLSFMEQLKSFQVPVLKNQVTNIIRRKGKYLLTTEDDEYMARVVIVAPGVHTAKALPGEVELLGRGVSYCATCDGSLYKNRKIAIICNCTGMEHEVTYLAQLADTVYYDSHLQATGALSSNTILLDEGIQSIDGQKRVTGITLKSGKQIEVDAVFIIQNSIAPDMLVYGIHTEKGHIVVNREMETNLLGCYAAGDCTGTPYQIAKAVGEGNIAAHAVVKYLAQ